MRVAKFENRYRRQALGEQQKLARMLFSAAPPVVVPFAALIDVSGK